VNSAPPRTNHGPHRNVYQRTTARSAGSTEQARRRRASASQRRRRGHRARQGACLHPRPE
jgi:hypothetical protein